ncbi:toll/interleukin-1 receptor domain-containing protein [Nocardiopsis sp. CNT-189]|uniref:toll/interleukin-1 receptor domain-containing protein n=1 Tax=Nocardiopsis oceanisediminis TaxID=2816862 RepID=UPI003B318942
MNSVFVNYRSSDEEASATLVERELSARFGADEIFRASKSIRPGEDFERALLRAVHRCDLLLAVIGPRWLDAPGREGGRALDDPDDWTRREIAEAFAYGITVVPVLVGSAGRLPEGALPEDIAALGRCQYRRLNHRNAEADIGRLAETVAELVPGLARRAPAGEEKADGARVRNTVGGRAHAVSQAHTVNEYRRGGIGQAAADGGTVIGSSHGPVHTGTGDQVNGAQIGTQIQGDQVGTRIGTQIQGDQVNGPQVNGPQFNGDGVNYVAGDNKDGGRLGVDVHGRKGAREQGE